MDKRVLEKMEHTRINSITIQKLPKARYNDNLTSPKMNSLFVSDCPLGLSVGNINNNLVCMDVDRVSKSSGNRHQEHEVNANDENEFIKIDFPEIL